MKLNKLTLNTAVATALLGSAVALPTTPLMAEEAATKSLEVVQGVVRLVVKREKANNEVGYEVLEVPASEADRKEAELLRDPDVIRVERDKPMFTPPTIIGSEPTRSQSYTQAQSASATPLYNDPEFADQAYFVADSDTNSRLSAAHRRLKFNNATRVGVIDGGFVRSPDVVYTEGYSFDFGEGPEFYNSDPGTQCEFLGPGEKEDIHGHWVSQVLGALTDNGIGIAGAAKNLELVAARTNGCVGVGFAAEISEAIRWLAGATDTSAPTISQKVDVINMSVAGEYACPGYMQDAVDFARAEGLTVVVATGNESGDSSQYAPANCNGVVAVAATRANGTLADFSNTGANTDVAAQGDSIRVLDDEGKPMLVNGTSFATPIVAGIVASTLSDRPGLTPAQLEGLISTSAKPATTNGGPQPAIGAGILDAMLMLDGAGVARELVAAQSALAGEREQYAQALSHPKAQAFLQANTGGNDACSLYEIDGRFAENAAPDDTLALFRVNQGEPLDPRGLSAAIIASTADSERLLVTQDDVDLSASFQLGIAHCDISTGSNCSVVDTIQALDPDQMSTPAACG